MTIGQPVHGQSPSVGMKSAGRSAVLIQFSDNKVIFEFEQPARVDDLAHAIAQLALWLELELDVRIVGGRVIVTARRPGP